MQPRGDAADVLSLAVLSLAVLSLAVRSSAGQHGGEAIPATAVGQLGPADLPVVATRGDELGQGELVKPGGSGGKLGRHRVEQARRNHQPAEPQARGQALAGRAGVDDVIGRERLQRADRLPVVAELSVVVVLDHDAAPRGHLPAAARMKGHAQRELVRRGQQRGVSPAGLTDDGAHRVNGHRPQAKALPGDDVTVLLVTVGLHGQGGRAGRTQRAADDGQSVAEPRADHDAPGIGGDAPRPGQVPRQRRPQLWEPARVRVAEEVIGGGRQHLAGRREPGAARERGQVRYPRTQVIAGHGRLRAAHGGGAEVRGRTRRDGGSRAGLRGQPPLRDELAVDLGDRIAGDTQVRGQGPGRRQARAGAQAPGLDRAAQRGLQTSSHPGPGKVQVEVDPAHRSPVLAVGASSFPGGFGPSFRHRTGPYLGPFTGLAWWS